MRKSLLMAVLVACAALCTACGGGEPEGPPKDRFDRLIENASIGDAEAIVQAAHMLSTSTSGRIVAEGTTVERDASGAPALHFRLNPQFLETGSQVMQFGDDGPMTPDKERSLDRVWITMSVRDLAGIARVGAARNLRFIEFTIVKTVATENGDEDLEIFRATIPRENLAPLGAHRDFMLSGDVLAASWVVDFDHYDTLTYE